MKLKKKWKKDVSYYRKIKELFIQKKIKDNINFVGEFVLKEYRPVPKTKESFLEQYESTYHDQSTIKKLIPMTLEGCVVRISDIIAYIGKDIEDAVTMGVIGFDEIPKDITDILGVGNKDTLNTLVMDVINNSYGKDYISMSPKVFDALVKLKDFNYKNIYSKANTEEMLKHYEEMFRCVFDKSLNAVMVDDKNADIFKVYLNHMSANYLESTSDERKVIDYISGMTDDFLISQYEKIK